MTRDRFHGRRLTAGIALTLAAAAVAVHHTAAQQQPPTFRASVDLVAVDVQVIDKTGTPVARLQPADFQVTIDGKRRKVVSADFIVSAAPDGHAPTALAIAENPAASGSARTFVLAFDTDSFTVGESRDVTASARSFVRSLRSDDAVGLYTFPVGPRLEPTLDHAAVSRTVDTIVGRSQALIGEYNLSPAEIIDITAESARDVSRTLDRATTPTATGNANAGANAGTNTNATTNMIVPETALQRVQLRECGMIESSCGEAIKLEALSKAFYLEGRAMDGINGLRSLIQLLGERQTRKTVVVFSSGIPATDRPGGRPQVSEIARQLGQDAAATNTTIYTLLIDTRGFQSTASETRKNDRIPTSLSRENAVNSRLLEEFSDSSGGALIRVLMGGGDVALTRVLRETSSHYLLGVEPADTDRDGKLRELRVKIGRSDATIRSRSWVVVPKRTMGS